MSFRERFSPPLPMWSNELSNWRRDSRLRRTNLRRMIWELVEMKLLYFYYQSSSCLRHVTTLFCLTNTTPIYHSERLFMIHDKIEEKTQKVQPDCGVYRLNGQHVHYFQVQCKSFTFPRYWREQISRALTDKKLLSWLSAGRELSQSPSQSSHACDFNWIIPRRKQFTDASRCRMCTLSLNW